MNTVTKQIILDVYSSDFPEIIRAQQGDTNSRIIEIALYNQDAKYTITSGLTVKIEGQRGDNSLFSKTCTYSGNIVTLTLDDDILLYSGTVKAKIVIYDSGAKAILSSVPFKIAVEKAPCDTNAEVIAKQNLYNDLLSRITTLESKASEKRILGIKTATVTAESVAAGESVDLTTTVAAISNATSYMSFPKNFTYCTPTSVSYSGSKATLSVTLQNVTTKAHDLTATFYVVGYA